MRPKLKRRDFLKTGALAGAAALSASIFRRHSGLASTAASGPPNIILIIVDELRYPMTFPGPIKTPDEFLAKYMPNLYNSLWTEGVKFSRHYTAASDCTPSRGIIATGLHAHQTNMLTTRAPFFAQNLPELDPDFPTYGKLLRELGYETPYIGKWHLSDSPASPHAPGASEYLQPYGFQGLTMPDPLGLPGQGIGASLPLGPLQSGDLPIGDAEIATQAVRWLGRRASTSGSKPFCLTVSFINPHDKQFFWAGIDVKRFKEVYASIPERPFLPYTVQVEEQVNPPSYGYELPANWESEAQLRERKPKGQTVFTEVFQYFMTGGISNNKSESKFTYAATPVLKGRHKAVAPFRYWTRALDLYTQAMTAADVQIGQLLSNIPDSIARNTVFVFTADHGEYASAHGLQGKGGTVYEEGLRVPLIVVDPSGRFTSDVKTVRTQLTCSADLLPLLVSLGHEGSNSWITGDYQQLYGNRADLLSIAHDPSATGRDYVLHTTDEAAPESLNFLGAGDHVVGLITKEGKLGAYSHWTEDAPPPAPADTAEKEYYDYSSDAGRKELQSTPNSSSAKAAFELLTTKAIPSELTTPLPERYRAAQQRMLASYWKYIKTINARKFV